MFNYINADLSRIFKHIPRVILMLISLGVYCLAIFISNFVLKLFTDPTMGEFTVFMNSSDIVFNSILQVAGVAMGLFGLFELIFVFSDDIKAKTSQIAIGVGVNRTKIVLSKFFELLILLAADMIAMFGLSLLMSGLLGSLLTGAQILELAGTLAKGLVLTNLAYSSLVFLILFTSQSMTVAILAFLALNFHVVSSVIGMTNYVKALQPLNLSSYTLTSMLSGAAANPASYIGVAAYIAAALGVTALLFGKKELEF